MKVVFDTNALVSALVFPGGSGEEALQRILEERDELLLSKAILDEVLGVLARKFGRDAEELSRAAIWLSEIATPISPARRLRVLKDAADNRILECAVAGTADLIVTGDKAMLALGTYAQARIVTLREYLGSRR